jgi:hypothetical protein
VRPLSPDARASAVSGGKGAITTRVAACDNQGRGVSLSTKEGRVFRALAHPKEGSCDEKPFGPESSDQLSRQW